MTTILARICPRRDTAANFTDANPVLELGELARETDTGKLKFGDGATAWTSLAYWNAGGVSSFNTRTGAVTLTYADVTGALGITPVNAAGAITAVAGAASGLIKSNGSALSSATAGAGGDYVAPGAVTGSGLTMSTARLLGRDTASTGAVEEISIGSGLTLSGGALSGSSILLGQSAVAQSITGTTAETTLATITVPANAMGANGWIVIDLLFTFPSSANAKTLRARFGGTSYLSVQATTSTLLRTTVFVANRGATNSQVGSQIGGMGVNLTPLGLGSGTSATTAIDTTSAVNITLTAQLANTGETITLEAYSVRLFK